VTFLSEKVDYVDHGPTGTEESSKVVTVDGRELHARAVLDATGHARRLVEFEEEFTPGYQVTSAPVAPPEEFFGAQTLATHND
jgi:lycopene beta-cyclase